MAFFPRSPYTYRHSRSYGHRYSDYGSPYDEDMEYVDSFRRYSGFNQSHSSSHDTPCPDALGWSIDYATAFIIEKLNKEKEKAAANIQYVREWARARDPYSVFESDIFEALDTTLFAGKLKGAVYLKKAPRNGTDELAAGATHLPGVHAKRITISLNMDVLANGRTGPSFAHLLHQMIHAYFLVTCGTSSNNVEENARLFEHGMHFGKVMYAIRNIWKLGHQGRTLPLRFSQSLPECGNRGQGYGRYDFYSGFRNGLNLSPSNADHSTCGSFLHDTPEDVVNAWYNTTCSQVLKSPDCTHSATIFERADNGDFNEVRRCSSALLSDSERYVEIVYNGKAYSLSRERTESKPSLAKVFEGGKRFLEISSAVPEEIFKTMWDFIYKGCYDPSLASMQSLGRELKGPPVISQHVHGYLDPLLTDVRVFKLADAIKFEELRDMALNRLKMLPTAYGLVTDTLLEIYSQTTKYIDGDYEPHADLRKWTIDFLKRTNSYRPSYMPQSNLSVLRTRMGYPELYHCSSKYREDERATNLSRHPMAHTLGHGGYPRRLPHPYQHQNMYPNTTFMRPIESFYDTGLNASPPPPPPPPPPPMYGAAQGFNPCVMSDYGSAYPFPELMSGVPDILHAYNYDQMPQDPFTQFSGHPFYSVG